MIMSRCFEKCQYRCFEGWNVVYECLKRERQWRDRLKGGDCHEPLRQHRSSRLLCDPQRLANVLLHPFFVSFLENQHV